MTTNFYDLAQDRDHSLVLGLCSAARSKRSELREWIEAELKALLASGEMHEPLSDGVIKERIQQSVSRLRAISHQDLPEAVSYFDDVYSEVWNGGYDSPNDAYDQLESAIMKLVQIWRELQRMRPFIGEM